MTISHASLDSLGYSSSIAASLDAIAPTLTPARVIAHLGSTLQLGGCTAQHGELSGRLRHELTDADRPTVGDWVAVADGDRAIIHHVLPRRSALRRRAAGQRGEPQAIAANVDTFLIVTSANRDANPRRLERYLAAVWDSGARPVVVLNKIDLCDAAEAAAFVAQLAASAPGVPVLPLSAATGAGMDALATELAPGRTVAFVGMSGVGKSSLVNRLLGHQRQATLAVDDVDRGRHTTTKRELLVLPGGAILIDTPGMRAFGLVEDDGGLAAGFADVEALAASCRFSDCQHGDEPGCAVQAALDDGDLDAGRLASFHKLGREIAAAERRRDPAAAARTKQQWKAIHVGMRQRAKVDPKLRR